MSKKTNYSYQGLYFKGGEAWISDSIDRLLRKVKDQGIKCSKVDLIKRLIVEGIRVMDSGNQSAKAVEPGDFTKGLEE